MSNIEFVIPNEQVGIQFGSGLMSLEHMKGVPKEMSEPADVWYEAIENLCLDGDCPDCSQIEKFRKRVLNYFAIQLKLEKIQ